MLINVTIDRCLVIYTVDSTTVKTKNVFHPGKKPIYLLFLDIFLIFYLSEPEFSAFANLSLLRGSHVNHERSSALIFHGFQTMENLHLSFHHAVFFSSPRDLFRVDNSPLLLCDANFILEMLRLGYYHFVFTMRLWCLFAFLQCLLSFAWALDFCASLGLWCSGM